MNLADRAANAVNRDRLLDTAFRLVSVPSRTGEAGEVADCLHEILRDDGFTVQRVEAGHVAAPAVIARWPAQRPGRTLQFNGHLDVVHLPYVAPSVSDGLLRGSGSCDMKGGVAIAVEALRAVRDADALEAGLILFTANDLHEAPWGHGQQLNELIRSGIHGDAVLIPEPLNDRLPVIGRGSATWKARIRRAGPPVHEVMRNECDPNVIAAAADLVTRLMRLDAEIGRHVDAQAGRESLFIGQIHGGEIFNQYPQECWLEGTRRWLPDGNADRVEADLRARIQRFADDWNVEARLEYLRIREAFRLNLNDPLVGAFQQSFTEMVGKPLPIGPKLFVDDGNSFWGLAGVPAITHGARAGGQHTTHEWIDIDDMVRVAKLYARVAVRFCAAA
jgi:acetylornithine deacetylase/succinyl-diaminopimelate desuccinylase-like protein